MCLCSGSTQEKNSAGGNVREDDQITPNQLPLSEDRAKKEAEKLSTKIDTETV